MKQFILLCALILPSLAYSQIDSVSHNLIPLNVDSIQFSVWKILTKEMSTPGNMQEYEKKLEQVTLTKREQELFIGIVRNPISYNYSSALLDHYNLVFDFYDKDSVITRIRISTMTGNVYIENQLDRIYFRNNCSEPFGLVLLDLLNNYGFSKLFDEVDLQGIISLKK